MNKKFYFQLLFYILLIIGFAQLIRAIFLQTSTSYNYDLGRLLGLIILSLGLFFSAWIVKKKWIQ